MTAPRGSGGSRRDPRLHGAGAAGAGAKADDDGDEAGADAELRTMRRVWLEMREQEPPAAGMSALLAAARAQAIAMQPRPTWRQRMLAAHRRPPVLALATVVVLIGGAVLVTRRIASVPSAGAPMSAADRAREVAGAGLDVSAAAPGAATAADEPTEAAVPAAAAEPEAAAPTLGAGPTSRSRAAQPTRGGGGPSSDPAPGARDDEVRGEQAASVGDRRPPVPTDPGARKEQRAGATRSSMKHDASAQEAESPAAPPVAVAVDGAPDGDAPVAADAVAAPGGKGAGPERTADRRSSRGVREPAAATGSLYQQCEVAAARGDCTAVRRLVEQITSKDPGYRSRLARDSAVARCLPE